MISFRYHLITIVAIFLSISLGIVMGTTFVQDPLLDQLRQRTDRLDKDNQELQERLEVQGRQLAATEAFAQAVFPRLATSRLEQVPVVILTQARTADDDLEATRAALEQSGAVLQAELVVQPRIQANAEGARAELADALGMSPETSPQELTEAATERLGRRLATGADGATSETDVLAALLSAGFVTSPREPDVQGVGGVDTVVIVVAGGPGAPAMEIEDVLLPILRSFVRDGIGAAAQATDSEYPFVELVRSDDALVEEISTVDDVDLVAGQLALVLAVEDLVKDGAVGHYGTEGAALPPLDPSPSP